MQIVIQGISFSHTPSSEQTVTIKYRKTSDPDVEGSYTIVTSNLVVPLDGNIEPDVVIDNLEAGTYSVLIINNCSGRGVRKDFTLESADIYLWVEDAYICEQESVFQQTGQVSGLSSPAILFYDNTSALVYGVDYDSPDGTFFSYSPVGFDSLTDLTFYPAILKTGAQRFMYGATYDAPSRKLFACGKDSDGIQVFDIASGIVTVIPWGCNHNVEPICGSAGVKNGYPRASLTNIGGEIVGIDKYSNTIISVNPSTLAVNFNKNIVDIAYSESCLIGGPVVAKINNQYWVLNSQGNSTEDPEKSPDLYIYSNNFDTLVNTIPLGDYSATWTNGIHSRATFYDAPRSIYYVFDSGASTMVVINTDLNAVVFNYNMPIRQNKTNAAFGFVEDPITKELFLTGNYSNSLNDASAIPTAYRINKDDYSFTDVYPSTSFSNLTRIANTSELHGANLGLPGWAGTGSPYTDGKIIKFTK